MPIRPWLEMQYRVESAFRDCGINREAPHDVCITFQTVNKGRGWCVRRVSSVVVDSTSAEA